MKRTSVVVGLGIALAWAGLSVVAGPITPPAGPVMSTAKPLSEIEPRIAVNAVNTPGGMVAAISQSSLYIISAPGSYYLTANVVAPAGYTGNGITILSDNVSLDLNGFSVMGVTGSKAGVRLYDPDGVTPCTIRNGFVTGWGTGGIDGNSSFSQSMHVANIQAMNNGGTGIGVYDRSIVKDCFARGNGSYGIYAASNSLVSSCVVTSNTDSGIFAQGSVVADCVADFNQTNGIETIGLDGTCSVTRCTCEYNTTVGFSCSAGTLITHCAAVSNGIGFQIGSGANLCDCSAYYNRTHGISAGSDCRIFGNTCNDNGASGVGTGAGIYTTGSNNRIEGNNCSNADRGIETATGSAGNLIIKNSCSGNTINYLFVANNRYGPILDITSATAAVSGNTAPSTLTTTDPNANFRY